MVRFAGICNLLAILLCTACGQVPEIREKEIVFLDGKVLRYEVQKRAYATPEEALARGEPVALSETPRLIQSWKRLALVRIARLYEGETREVTLYNYHGNLLGPPRKIVGDVFFLEKTGRILLAQRSAHYLVRESYLLDMNGGLVRTIPQPENVSAFGVSDDEQIIWITSERIENSRPVGQLSVLDLNGEPLSQFSFTQEGVIEIDHEGKHYRITVNAPQVPG